MDSIVYVKKIGLIIHAKKSLPAFKYQLRINRSYLKIIFWPNLGVGASF